MVIARRGLKPGLPHVGAPFSPEGVMESGPAVRLLEQDMAVGAGEVTGSLGFTVTVLHVQIVSIQWPCGCKDFAQAKTWPRTLASDPCHWVPA